MKWHKFKIWALTNRNNFIFYIACVAMLSTFIVNIITLQQILAQSQRNEQLLKGHACILLIAPEERTQTNVEKCIEKNAPDPDEPFQFNSFDAPIQENNSSKLITVSIPVAPTPVGPRVVAQAPPVQNTPQPETPQERKKYTRMVDGKEQYQFEGDLQWVQDE